MVTVAGARMQGGWGPASWLLTVIALLAILQLHNMVSVAGTRMPRELLLQNCLKVWIVGIICLGMVCLLVSFSSFVFSHLLKLLSPSKKKKVINS
jgi:predicted CDP-diglyceride synthetase/phosphatidate cytidylyltransferase